MVQNHKNRIQLNYNHIFHPLYQFPPSLLNQYHNYDLILE